jgi:hypothetical protein
MKNAGWWLAGSLLLTAGILGAANGARTTAPAPGNPILVQVDDDHVVNMAAVAYAHFTGKESDGRWHLYFRYVGDPAAEPLVFKDEKTAREAWARITAMTTPH